MQSEDLIPLNSGTSIKAMFYQIIYLRIKAVVEGEDGKYVVELRNEMIFV